MPSSSSYEYLRNRSIAIENREKTPALENGPSTGYKTIFLPKHQIFSLLSVALIFIII